uniref:AWPM-19-like family protein n=1 Tax=Kalanchoe fedtschenkoi TaxID=63787 RepID=A0A7N0VLI5_KALFE
MASAASKSAASLFLILNLLIYFIIIVIASWAVNHAIAHSHEAASSLKMPAHIFPIFFPMGNMATGFFIMLSLITGVVGFIASLTAINDVVLGTLASLHAAASSSTIAWLLTLLSMGLACKEISTGWAGSSLRALEVLTIIVSGSQLICTSAIHAGLLEEAARHRMTGSRV